jgi:diacylglycerol kinase (ATP)
VRIDDSGGRDLRRSAEGTDAVVVVGGDGTVNVAAQQLAQTGTALGIVPGGTGNDLADAVGLPPDPLEAADTLLDALDAGCTRDIDLGRVEDGPWWATVLCAGFDSAVNERANRMRRPAGPRRYDVAIVAELARLRPRTFLLQLDGRYLDGPATLVAIGNGPQYGGGKLITPDARLDDGRFQITVVGPVSRATLARLAPTLPRAGHLRHPAVRTYRATTVSIDAADTVAYADGERIGPLPLRTRCVPGALRVLVPPSGVGRGLTPR